MERYVLRGGREGFDRLRVLSRAKMASTSALLDRVGVVPGARVLDVGCGSGDVTLELARRAGPSGHVTGLDMNVTNVELARALARENGVEGVEFEVRELGDWHELSSYDIVYCRFVLQHLTDPLGMLTRMWAAVRPGGALVVEDSDFGGLFCHPPNEGFAFYARTHCDALRRRGGDPEIGRKLLRYFVDVGIQDPLLTVTQNVDATGEAKRLAPLTLAASADAIVADGLATANEVAAALSDLAAFADDPTTVIGGPRTMQVWARKPG